MASVAMLHIKNAHGRNNSPGHAEDDRDA